MKKFVISNINSNINLFKQVLKKSNFHYEKDMLLLLGNIVDINKYKDMLLFLSKIKNTVYCKGYNESMLLKKGIDIGNILDYFVYDDCLFMYEGFNPNHEIHKQPKFNFDNQLVKNMESNIINGFEKVFMGRLTTQRIEREIINFKCRDCFYEWEESLSKNNYHKLKETNIKCEKCKSNNIFQSIGCTKPIKIGNLYCINTCSFWDGKLTLFNIETEEFFQSKLQEPLKKMFNKK